MNEQGRFLAFGHVKIGDLVVISYGLDGEQAALVESFLNGTTRGRIWKKQSRQWTVSRRRLDGGAHGIKRKATAEDIRRFKVPQ